MVAELTIASKRARDRALSTGTGRISVRWHRQVNGKPFSPLVLEWQEIGGPPVVAPGKSSYGTSTIDLIPYEFGGSVDLLLDRDGVRCRLELPADWLSNDAIEFAARDALERGTRTAASVG